MDIVTQAAQSYVTTFSGYVSQFLHWGQWLFFSLLTINLVWLALWYAFDSASFTESMPAFIKRFFGIAVFYTLMLHPEWLGQIVKTMEFMGTSLVHAPVDPSSLISAGIGLGNKIIIPIEKSSLFTVGFGVIILAIVYIVVLFVFISIALDLALTLIITTALITVASLFLGFAALGATSQIARQTLDVILANCVKLLGIYLVVAAGSQTITAVTASVPAEIVNFDPYAWIVAVTLLFWLLAKHLPNQLAKIVSGAIQETHGHQSAALAMATLQYARTAMPVARLATTTTQTMAKVAGSTAYNAGVRLSTHDNPALGLGAAAGGSLLQLGKAVGGNVADHFKHIASKLAGGPGSQQPIESVATRMYQNTKDLQSGTQREK